MLNKIKNSKGFTIVEVMIVLAIGAMIILIVFLAVPALQRNSRNTQRNQDAAMIASGINECLNNRNGQSASCDEWDDELDSYIDTAKLRQLTTVDGDAALPSDTTTANVDFGVVCNPNGSAPSATGANSRSAVVLYNTENTTGDPVARCIEV